MSPFQFTSVVLALACVLAAGPVAAQAPAPAKPGANDQMPTPNAKSSPSPLQPGDAFGEQVTLPERTIVYMKGHTNWDTAFDTLVDAFKSLQEYLDKQDVKPAGPAITIYTQTDDTGFSYQAALPVAQAPKDPPKGDISIGPAPSGKALKFVHRGSYDAMDSTY
ncbi:MAG: GyrI-like domain-containing protein, partial [Pseudolabrys sp.]